MDQTIVCIKAQELTADLEELQSRGFGHPAADQIVGRMRVSLQQLADAQAAPPPAPEPESLQAMMTRVQDDIKALHDVACTIKAAMTFPPQQ